MRPCGCLCGLIPARVDPRGMPAACSFTVPERCDGVATGTRFHQLGLALGFRVSLSLVTVSATVGLTDASEAAGVPHASRARGLAACMPAAMPAAMCAAVPSRARRRSGVSSARCSVGVTATSTHTRQSSAHPHRSMTHHTMA